MSYFGDSPHQDLYEVIQVIQKDYGLTNEELLAILLSVLIALFDPLYTVSDGLRKRKRV